MMPNWLHLLAEAWPGEIISHAIAFTLGMLKSAAVFAKRKYVNREFRKVFGRGNKIHLIVGELTPIGTQTHPFNFHKPSFVGQAFRADKVASMSEVRASAYLSSKLVASVGIGIASDEATRAILDADYIALGAMNNQLSRSMFDVAQVEFHMSTGQFISKTAKRPIKVPAQPNHDYGVLLKMHPVQFPERTWITCSGYGEWGTSGAAWFLANRWRKIADQVQHSAFVAVIDVEREKDESATLLWICKDSEAPPTA
jgi:hypothetical protein